jgi:L-ribulose-5-phosphate 3-epimerase
MASARLGIMQGRLSPPEVGRFQSFPRNSWRQEFARARDAGLDYIEWIYDDYGASLNPIASQEGRELLQELKAEFRIDIPAICVDWLMDFPVVRCDPEERLEREGILRQLLLWGAQTGMSRLVLPFVDASSMRTPEEKEIVIRVLENALPLAKRIGVEIHIEADLDPHEFAQFLNNVDDPAVKVNYDSGNSSGLGYIASDEFSAYGKRIGSIHIKDRLRKLDGSVETKPLGQGSANFDDVFASIRSIGYSGGFTLQVARGRNGDEVNWAKQQAAFVRSYWM